MKQHILAVGADPTLLYTRGLLLEKSGATVTTATSEQAFSLIPACNFQLLVLCHSLTHCQMHELCLAAQQCAHIITLLLEAPRGASRIPLKVHSRFSLEQGPRLFVQTVQSLLALSDRARYENATAITNITPFIAARSLRKLPVGAAALASENAPLRPPAASGETTN